MSTGSTANLRLIASEAGVSVDTVSRVLNGRLKGMRRDAVQRAARIQQIAATLNYRPDSTARAMRSKRTQQVGVLIRNNPGDRYTHPHAFETIVGINEGLEAEGFVLSIIRIGDVEKGGGRSRALRERTLDGIVVIDAMTDAQQAQIGELFDNVIWCDSNVWHPTHCVRRDEVWAGRRAAEAMIDLGYRRLMWLGIPEQSRYLRNYSLPARHEGAKQAAEAAGVEWIEQVEPDSHTPEHSLDLFNDLTPDTAVIAYGINQARWITHMAASLGKTPPYTFGLVSCDGSHDMFRLWPNLSRVDFDRFALGQAASRMLIGTLESRNGDAVSQQVRDRYVPGNTAWGPMGNE